jgi:flagellar hook-basal body complex protein FliE
MKKPDVKTLAESIMSITASGSKRKFQFSPATVVSRTEKTEILNKIEKLRKVRSDADAFGLANINGLSDDQATVAIAENQEQNLSKVQQYIESFDEEKMQRLSDIIKDIEKAEHNLDVALEI